MFKHQHVRSIVENGGVVEYKNSRICDLKQIMRYPFDLDTPYQVNLRNSRYNKDTGEYEGDALYSDINEAINAFLQECR